MIERVQIWTHGTVVPRGTGGAMAWTYFIIVGDKARKVESLFVPPHPNNSAPLAEYNAIASAVAFIGGAGWERQQIRFFSDNLLVVRQLNGLWKIKDPLEPYAPYHRVITLVAKKWRDVAFSWVAVEENLGARRMVDEQFRINNVEPLARAQTKEEEHDG